MLRSKVLTHFVILYYFLNLLIGFSGKPKTSVDISTEISPINFSQALLKREKYICKKEKIIFFLLKDREEQNFKNYYNLVKVFNNNRENIFIEFAEENLNNNHFLETPSTKYTLPISQERFSWKWIFTSIIIIQTVVVVRLWLINQSLKNQLKSLNEELQTNVQTSQNLTTSKTLNDSQQDHNLSNFFFSSASYGQQSLLSNTSSVSNLFPPELLETYHSNPKLLEQKAIKVSPTEESLLEHRSDYRKPIFFRSKPNGKYLIMSGNDSQKDLVYWLFPTPDMEINQYNLATINFLFKGNLEQAKFIDQLKLRKPARVSTIDDIQEVWQLEERGELNPIFG